MSNKIFVDFNELTPEELWNYNLLEYKTQNIISNLLYANFYKRIKAIIKQIVLPGNKLLEVGCGAAESSTRIFSFLNNNCSFEASEFDNRYVSIINEKKFPFRVIQESVYELKRKNNEFDLIFFLEVLEHLEKPEIAITQLFRVANKYVIISVPNEPIWRFCNLLRGKYIKDMGNTPGHLNHYNACNLKKILTPFSSNIKIYKPFPWIIAVAKVK